MYHITHECVRQANTAHKTHRNTSEIPQGAFLEDNNRTEVVPHVVERIVNTGSIREEGDEDRTKYTKPRVSSTNAGPRHRDNNLK